jgi:hypothetical protein
MVAAASDKQRCCVITPAQNNPSKLKTELEGLLLVVILTY